MSELIEMCPFGHFLSTIRQLRRRDSDIFLSIRTLFSCSARMVAAMPQEWGIREVANLGMEHGTCRTPPADMRTHAKGAVWLYVTFALVNRTLVFVIEKNNKRVVWIWFEALEMARIRYTEVRCRSQEGMRHKG